MATNLRLVAKIEGKLRDLLNEKTGEMAVAARAAVASASEALQAELRAQVASAGLGAGLEKAWQLTVFPQRKNASLNAAGLVYSKSVRLHAAFDKGGVARIRQAHWLVIPLPEAIRRGWDRNAAKNKNARVTGRANQFGGGPRKWSDVSAALDAFGDLRFVPLAGGGRALLVADAKATTSRKRGDEFRRASGSGRAASVPLFLLVRQVRIPKLLDIDGPAQRALARLKVNLSNIAGAAHA